MHKGKYVFAQLLDFIGKNAFLRTANKHDGNCYVKHFTCWNQLCVLMFGQLSNRESLRDLVLATPAHTSKAYHLGFGKHTSRSTLADAKVKRDCRIFEEFAYNVIAEVQGYRIVDIFMLNGKVYAFDSTTINLCLSTFEWALFRKKKGGVKIHTLYDLETQIPTFFHITQARVHDMKAMLSFHMKKALSTSLTENTMTSNVFITSRVSVLTLSLGARTTMTSSA